MLHDGRANFYEIQAEFESTWNNMENVRGSGWKPYKRWEYETEMRVYPSGEFPPRHQRYTEYYKFTATKGRTAQQVARNSNGNWQELGPKMWSNQGGWNPGIGRVNFIYEEPGNPNTIYVGTPAGGLWRSEDAGQSWTPLTDHLPSMGVSGIAVDPANPEIIYIATGDRDANDYNGVGVLKSTDYGSTWQTTGMAWNISDGVKSNWMIMDPTDSQTLYLATNDGLFKTEDGAGSWFKIHNSNIREVALHPTNPEIVYAVSSRLYRSSDGGLTFQTITEGLPFSSLVNRMSLAVSAASPDIVYILAGDNNDSGLHGLYRSTDAGLSFSLRTSSPNILGYSNDGSGGGGQSWYDLALAASQTNPGRIFTGGINVWRSNNGGTSFSPVSHWVYPSSNGYTHADIHFLRYYGNRLYCGSDGGIFRSDDNGGSWEDISAGIGNTQLYRMDFSEQDPYNILVGTQDNGTNILRDSTFFHVLGGDGNGAAVNNDNPDVMYASYPYGSIEISTNGGASFQGITQDIEEDGLWVTPYILDPSDQSVLYAGYQSIWRYTQSDGWEIVGDFGGESFRTLAVAPSENNYIYGSKSSTIYRTSDGGANWDILNGNIPNLNITEIAVNPENPQHIIATCSGYSQGNKVFESFDAGDNFNNISYNLPNIPANCVTFENGNEGGIYVGTDAGIFYTNNNLANWVDFMENLPKTSVRQLKISESIGKLRAGTYGRGIWESDLYTPSNEPPIAGFTSDVTVVCVGDSVQFTDLSYNAAPGWTWNIEGGSPSFSENRDPVVYFYEEGIYTVTLEVENQNGSDVATATEYIVVFGNGEIPPFSESYEGIGNISENQWFTTNSDQDVTWELNPETGFESTQSVWINSALNTTGKIDELVSPVLDLTNTNSALLTFKVAYAQKSEVNDDRLRLYISNNCGESWTMRGQWKGSTTLPSVPPTEEFFIPADESEWQMFEVSNITPAFYGPNFRFKFEFLSDNGNNLYIDDINLSTTMVGIEDAHETVDNFELYPNPARGQTTLEFSLQSHHHLEISVIDISGRQVFSENLGQKSPGEHRHTIHTYSLESGIYLVRLMADGESTIRKLFIE